MESRIAIGLTKREAEIYRSQGLFQESLDLYEHLLDETPGIDDQVKSSIKSKIMALKGDVEKLGQNQARALSEDEISLIQQNFGKQGSIQEISLRASAFHETGLYTEAIAEYCKLMGRAYPPDKYAATLTDCLLAEYADTSFIAQLNQILREAPIKGLEQALLLFHCGDELERRNYTNIALKLYKGAFRTLLGELKKARRAKPTSPTQEES